jgi:hypothetical protein
MHARHAAQREAPALLAASTASAAVSGRIAVPALPRNSAASCTAQLPAQAGDGQRAVGLRRSSVQPRACSAASITRVSSLSSRSRTTVVPALSPASSSTRLEMLLLPGRRTLPAAPRKGGRSRWDRVISCRRFARRRV